MTVGDESTSMVRRDLLSPRQVAEAFGVSESSLKRWCDLGLIATTLTPGGHRRLPLAGVMDFARKSKHVLARPEILGLPVGLDQPRWSWDKAVELLIEALTAGSEMSARQLLLEPFVRGYSIAQIGDLLIAPAMRQIGLHWQSGELEVYRERRACRMILRSLLELQGMLTPPTAERPLALGGTLEGDTYDLPSTLIEVVLQQLGWRAISLGSSLPTATLVSALHEHRPAMFWLSVSSIEDAAAFRTSLRELSAACIVSGTRLVVGGRSLEATLTSGMDSLHHYTSLTEFVANELNPATGEN